jgi:hypothetical protein
VESSLQTPADRLRKRSSEAIEADREAMAPSRGALPNLVVIGAQKCGTSVLHYYLSLHPEISMSKPKELNYFIEERNWSRGVDWYARHFDASTPVRGESSPNYTAYPQHMGVPERMASLVPDARLVYLVRDPLQRIEAHWVHNYAKRREKGDLATTLAHPNTSYLARSQYHMQLQRFLKHFSREQLLVLDQEDLRKDRTGTLRRVFEHVGVDPDFRHPDFDRERHRTSQKRRHTRIGARIQRMKRSPRGRRLPQRLWMLVELMMPLGKRVERQDVRGALRPAAIRALREDADRLRELTGRSFENWSL